MKSSSLPVFARLASPCLGAVLLGLILAGVAPAWVRAQQTVFLTDQQALKLAFPDADRIRGLPIRLTPEDIAAIEHAAGVPLLLGWTRCFQGSSNQRIVGYACIDNMIGKAKPITYIIRIDHPDGRIARLEVMEYREAIGAEVSSPPFVSQYRGKSADDPLQLKQDIRNISGATLSGRGLTDGARKILQLYLRYLKALPLF
jgi:hypothetical protein